MVKNKDEILQSLKGVLGESTDDDALSLIEDITDTIEDYESRTADQTDWKQKYQDNDASWRQKYKERFFGSGSDEDPAEPDVKPLTYESLFK